MAFFKQVSSFCSGGARDKYEVEYLTMFKCKKKSASSNKTKKKRLGNFLKQPSADVSPIVTQIVNGAFVGGDYFQRQINTHLAVCARDWLKTNCSARVRGDEGTRRPAECGSLMCFNSFRETMEVMAQWKKLYHALDTHTILVTGINSLSFHRICWQWKKTNEYEQNYSLRPLIWADRMQSCSYNVVRRYCRYTHKASLGTKKSAI